MVHPSDPGPTERSPTGTERRRRERGAAAVELALVVWVFAAVFYGIVAFGSALALKQSVTSAVSEGARAAVGVLGDPSAPDPQAATETAQADAARERVAEVLDWTSKFEADELFVTFADCDPPNDAQRCITVRLDYDYAERPIVPNAPGLSIVLPSTLSSEAVVQVPSY